MINEIMEKWSNVTLLIYCCRKVEQYPTIVQFEKKLWKWAQSQVFVFLKTVLISSPFWFGPNMAAKFKMAAKTHIMQFLFVQGNKRTKTETKVELYVLKVIYDGPINLRLRIQYEFPI